jgi:hypothetical protein
VYPYKTALIPRSVKADLFFKGSKQYSGSLRDLVLTLDFRPLKLLEKRLPREYSKFSHVTTPKYAFQFVPCFENLRFLVINNMGHFDYEYPEDTEIRQPIEDASLLLFSSAGTPFLDYSLLISTPILHNAMYLDLSNTSPTQGWSALLSSHAFVNLRILKLRSLRLTDQNLQIPRAGLRLWSLDLRDNSLTDLTIDILLEDCFAEKIKPPSFLREMSDEILYEDPPTYYTRDESDPSYPAWRANVPMRPDTSDTFIAYMKQHADLKSHSSQVLPDNDLIRKGTGLTHLYLSDNRFTSVGVRKLLESTNRLQVLDVGTVRANPSWEYVIPHTTPFCQPNTSPSLHLQTGTRMETLRIHHSIITATPTIAQGRLEFGYIAQHLRKTEKFGEKDPESFNPLNNYRLSSLTLSDIPLKSTGPTIKRLIDFLRLCATQEQILSAARSGPRNHRSPRVLPGLRRLRLEFINERAGAEEIGPSVSGDQDADEFQAQSMGDFSFFADEKMPPSPMSRRGSEIGGWAASWPLPASAKSSLVEIADMKDVVEELKIFRKEEEPRWGGSLELVVPMAR